MKIYAIFPNPKSGLIEEQLIEIENYTQEELNKIALYDIYRNAGKIPTDTTLDDYKLKISAYINDYARTKYTYTGNKCMDIVFKNELDTIVDAVEQALILYYMKRKEMGLDIKL